MRKILVALLMMMCVSITQASAEGTVTSELRVTVPAEARVKFIGNIGEAVSKELSLLIKKSSADFNEGVYLDGKCFYTKEITTADDGSFELEFIFDAETALYEVYLSDIYNTGSGYIYDFNYITYEDAISFVEALGKKEISESDLVAELNKYSDSLGIGYEEMENLSKKEYIAKDIFSCSEIIKVDKIDGVKRVINFSGARFDILNEIANAKLSGDVYTALTKNAELAELPSALTQDFITLNSSKQTEVCLKLMGKKLTYSGFLTEFENAVTEAKKPTTSAGGSSGSGGGSGGGAGGSSAVSNKTGISGGGYVMVTETENGGENIPAKNRFSDTESVPWAVEAIEYLSEQGIVDGVGDDKFEPNGELTREQLAKIIVGAYNCYNENAECVFSDVPSNSWAAKYIASAFDNDLMNGISETEFGMGKKVIRQDAALVLYRFARLIGVEMTAAELDFDDTAQISDYSSEAVSSMYGTGIINGMDNNLFAPKAATTRAQTCKMIYEVMKRGVRE